MVDETAKTKKDPRSRIFFLELLLKTEGSRVDEVVGDNNVLADWPDEYDAMRFCLQKRDEALHEAREYSTAALSKLESLRCNAKDFKETLPVARTYVTLQPSPLKKNCEQLDADLVELKELQSRLELRNEKLTTVYEQQVKTTAELAQ